MKDGMEISTLGLIDWLGEMMMRMLYQLMKVTNSKGCKVQAVRKFKGARNVRQNFEVKKSKQALLDMIHKPHMYLNVTKYCYQLWLHVAIKIKIIEISLIYYEVFQVKWVSVTFISCQ